jgi:protein-arginine kinase activator protein McsA
MNTLHLFWLSESAKANKPSCETCPSPATVQATVEAEDGFYAHYRLCHHCASEKRRNWDGRLLRPFAKTNIPILTE